MPSEESTNDDGGRRRPDVRRPRQGVVRTIQAASPSSVAATKKAIASGNLALCERLVKRATPYETATAQDECHIEAAIFLQQTEARQPHS